LRWGPTVCSRVVLFKGGGGQNGGVENLEGDVSKGGGPQRKTLGEAPEKNATRGKKRDSVVSTKSV